MALQPHGPSFSSSNSDFLSQSLQGLDSFIFPPTNTYSSRKYSLCFTSSRILPWVGLLTIILTLLLKSPHNSSCVLCWLFKISIHTNKTGCFLRGAVSGRVEVLSTCWMDAWVSKYIGLRWTESISCCPLSNIKDDFCSTSLSFTEHCDFFKLVLSKDLIIQISLIPSVDWEDKNISWLYRLMYK